MTEQKTTAQKIISAVIFIIEIAFVAIVLKRQFLFEPDSFIYNAYNQDLAENLYARLFKSLVALVLAGAVTKISDFITNAGGHFKSNKTKTTLLLLGNVLKYASAIVALFVILAYWGIDTTAIATGAGVVTLIVGLGCQSMISDIVTGIFILFEGDIQVGDVVVINGWRGTVQQIGLRRTRIEDAAGNINIINNSAITNVVNNTRDLSVAICDIGIDYGESLERVENVLQNNLDAIKREIPAIVEGPFYKGITFTDSAILVKLVAKCQEDDKYQVERDINREIKLLFDKHNIDIPFNQIVISQREEKSSNDISDAEIKAARDFLNSQKELSKNIEDQEE